jgi:hypothetical protein
MIMPNRASNIVTTRWQNKLQLVQRMAKLEKGEDKLTNGYLSRTSPKLSRPEHARVARKSDWRFGQKRGKNENS